jgi:hypothetical protein
VLPPNTWLASPTISAAVAAPAIEDLESLSRDTLANIDAAIESSGISVPLSNDDASWFNAASQDERGESEFAVDSLLADWDAVSVRI